MPEAFAAAMDDDLATPAALAVVHGLVREGNKLLADSDVDGLRGNLASVRAMLAILGLDPLAETVAVDRRRRRREPSRE